MFNRQNAKDKKPLPNSWKVIAIILIAIFSIVPTKYERQRRHTKNVEAYAQKVWLEQHPEAKIYFHN
jgi:hypothetical protein